MAEAIERLVRNILLLEKELIYPPSRRTRNVKNDNKACSKYKLKEYAYEN